MEIKILTINGYPVLEHMPELGTVQKFLPAPKCCRTKLLRHSAWHAL